MVNFFETFEHIEVDEKLADYFSGVLVEKVILSKDKNTVSIYVIADQILKIKSIMLMEQKLYKQLFRAHDIKPQIVVSYPFAKNFSLEKILEIYEENLKEEIGVYNNIFYSKFCNEKYYIKDDVLYIPCDDDFISKENAGEVKEYITSTLRRRFDRDINVEFEFIERIIEIDRTPVVYHVERPIEETEPEKKVDLKPKFEKKKKTGYESTAIDESVFYGRNVEGDIVKIVDIVVGIGDVVIDGMIRKVDTIETRTKKTIITFQITDFTDTIVVKLFPRKGEIEQLKLFDHIKEGNNIRLKGTVLFDEFDKEVRIVSVKGMKDIEPFVIPRKDNAKAKRVELHAHTQMSDNDALTDCKKMVKRAKDWGHQAIAVTDHGVVQAFPDAASEIKNDDIKVIYGCEVYLVDDSDDTVLNSNGQSLHDSFVVFDLETTGFSKTRNRIIEIGAVKIENGEITDRFSTFVNPNVAIPYKIVQLTNITDDMVSDAPTIDKALVDFLDFAKGSALVAHNANFDYGFIKEKGRELGIAVSFPVIDTVGISRLLLSIKNYKLDSVAKALKISLINHHRAVEDAEATAQIYEKLIKLLGEKGITNLDELYEFTHCAPEIVKKKPYYHAIVLAKNEVGRLNLYRLVSMSHLQYFGGRPGRPRVPKSKLNEYREGLILGSACEAGELYRALLNEEDDDIIKNIVEFYDYLEIQPSGNNEFMILSDKNLYTNINSVKDIHDVDKQIVKLGEKYNKPVCATCDVHFLDPDDAIYRTILQAGQGYKEEKQPPLFLRTTEEMLEEFSFLGEKKAYEVVIENTNKIADMIEVISPVYPWKCPPVIENSDKELREICYRKAVTMYGEDLPVQVTRRLEKELNSIISNGFAVMYIIAQKLVWKSNEDGYLVGSRGSVGSSFVATMSGITEVNPLPAHYYCEKCHYSDFDSDEVKAFAGSSGYDMPPKDCPNCGTPLIRDGHDIPFETFLGFYGDKEPDIDLNFSGEYQSKAHAYTEVIFGAGQTFRAGTVGTLAEKTAFGYVKNYFKDNEIHKRKEEIERLLDGCVGVKRTTGQHPGGIVVLPMGWDINTFTAIQHPANKDIPIITTHFDYHKIDHNLLKLDILGHDDPSIIKMLEDLTGVDAVKIPLDEPQVLSLFQSTKALGVTPDELMGLDLGSLGIPEFGTNFVMGMLRDTKPKNFSDLVRISGLSHGTDVWLNNAQEFIANGDCTLATAICTRDDIMTYLINTGVENGLAFNIMEAVRKGKVAKNKVDNWPEMEKAMLDAGVEPWYMESCKRIKYMFPKAHAVAYVMMAFRIAYFKVYYPVAYYTVFYSVRAKAFDYELMCQGKEMVEEWIKDYERKEKVKDPSLTPNDEKIYGDMKIVQEMYARGIEFVPIDIYKAKAKQFQIIDGKIMPALNTIGGMGDSAAEGVVEAVKDGEFSSCQNFKDRTKVSQTIVEKMRELNLLYDLPLSDQLSLLDYL